MAVPEPIRPRWQAPGSRLSPYTVGALVIAMFEGESRELVREGVGARRIDPSRVPEQSERQVADASERILRPFPPGQRG